MINVDYNQLSGCYGILKVNRLMYKLLYVLVLEFKLSAVYIISHYVHDVKGPPL